MAIIDVLKYEGDQSTFIWRHPREDFNIATQLVVGPSQEAIFAYKGQILDVFGPGTYTLTPANIPLIRDVIGLATGGVSPFHCQVYYANCVEQMAIKWGTDSLVQYMEPTYHFPLSIGVSGEMSLRVENAPQLLLRLLGTGSELNQQQLIGFFRSLLMSKIKPYIAQTMQNNSISIFQVDAQLDAFSQELKARLMGDFAEYGLHLPQFFVTTVVRPEDDKDYRRFKELYFRQYADVADAKLRQQVGVIDQQTEAQKTVIEAQGIAQKRTIEGYSYQQERSFDVAEKVAANEAVGEYANLGVGMGMITGVGGTLGGMVGSTVTGAMQSVATPAAGQGAVAPEAAPQAGAAASPGGFCEGCGAALEKDAAFCDQCGAPVPQTPGVCGKCGQPMRAEAKFCSRCGAPRQES